MTVNNALTLGVAGGGNGTYNLQGGKLTADTIAKGAGTGTFNFTGGILDVDNFNFDLSQNGGTLAAGASPGQTNIDGNYAMNSGILEVELAGYDKGVNFDFYDVSDGAALNGMLQLVVLPPFQPAANFAFEVLTASSITLGDDFEFDTTEAPLPGDLSWIYRIVDTADGQALHVSATPEPASLIVWGLLAALGITVASWRRRRKTGRL